MIKVVKKITRGDITKTILNLIQLSGIMSITLIAPEVLRSFEKLGITNFHKKQKGVINRARDILLKGGYLRKNSRGFLELTSKGRDKIKKYEISDYKLLIPRIWDRKWRILVFDIPEYRKNQRDKIRRTLNSIGFKRLQDSVWIFPYDCEELIALLKADFKVGKDLLYIVANKIENDFPIKKYFGLD